MTLIRMDAGLDTGPIVALEHSVLGGDETAPALEARLAIAAAGLLARVARTRGWTARSRATPSRPTARR